MEEALPQMLPQGCIVSNLALCTTKILITSLLRIIEPLLTAHNPQKEVPSPLYSRLQYKE